MQFIDQQSKAVLFSVTILLVILLGVVDYLTGFELSFSFFYLLPVSLAAWSIGRKAGVILSFSCSLVWLIANDLAGEAFSYPLVPYWNTLTRLGFFLVVTNLLTTLHNVLENERILARTDELTGALNRRAFYEAIKAEVARSQRYDRSFTIISFDIDDFKNINDHLGHNSGDRLLATVAQIVMQKIRAADILCRLGGDEFAILLPETDQNAAKWIVPRLQQELLNGMQTEHWAVTFSIGALTCFGSFATADKLIDFADRLMYDIKKTTKNGIQYATYEELS